MPSLSTVVLQIHENSPHKHDAYIPQWKLLVLTFPFHLDSVKPIGNCGRLRSQNVCVEIHEEDLNQCSVHRNQLIT